MTRKHVAAQKKPKFNSVLNGKRWKVAKKHTETDETATDWKKNNRKKGGRRKWTQKSFFLFKKTLIGAWDLAVLQFPRQTTLAIHFSWPFLSLVDEARVQVGACVRASNTSNSFNTNLLSVFIPSSLHFDRGFVLAAKRERIHKDVYSSFFFFWAHETAAKLRRGHFEICVVFELSQLSFFESSEIRRIGFKEKQNSARARTEAKFNLQLCIATAAAASSCAFVRGY